MKKQQGDGFATDKNATSAFQRPADLLFAARPDWYLIDLAKQPEALRELFTCDPAPQYDLPYLPGHDRDLALNGPLLAAPISQKCRDWLSGWVNDGRALALEGANLSRKMVCDHLASLNYADTPYGNALFRYADPTILGSFGNSLTALQRIRLLGPLSGISGFYGDHTWRLYKSDASTEPRNDSPETKKKSPFTLTHQNFEYIEQEREQRLGEALAGRYDITRQAVSTWFSQLKRLGAHSEQNLVEGSRILAQRGFTASIDELTLQTLLRTNQNWPNTLEALAGLVPKTARDSQ
jgi:hypothetical protein